MTGCRGHVNTQSCIHPILTFARLTSHRRAAYVRPTDRRLPNQPVMSMLDGATVENSQIRGNLNRLNRNPTSLLAGTGIAEPAESAWQDRPELPARLGGLPPATQPRYALKGRPTAPGRAFGSSTSYPRR